MKVFSRAVFRSASARRDQHDRLRRGSDNHEGQVGAGGRSQRVHVDLHCPQCQRALWKDGGKPDAFQSISPDGLSQFPPLLY